MTSPVEGGGGKFGYQGDRTSPVLRVTVLLLLVFFFLLLMIVWKVPPASTGSVPCDCESCHDDFHGANWSGCSGCHDSPPATGSHLVHYNTAPQMSMRYDDTTVRSTADAYIFGCGNCHPLSGTNHRNNRVDVELYNPAAPVDSIKAKNPASAAYDPVSKKCSDVYCHSGNTVTSGPVPLPTKDPVTGQLIYSPPYTFNIFKAYKLTPAWGTSGNFATCTECHAFPPTTYYPDVYAGVGDSHQWIDQYGYSNFHAYNMGYGYSGYAVPCATCHFDSVNHYGTGTEPSATYSSVNGKEVFSYFLVTIKNRSLHVNGSANVAFDPAGYVGYTAPAELASASYNAQAKTCSNVSCHLHQTNVTWGSPYRWDNSYECDSCHQFMH